MREILFRGQTRRYGEKVRVGDGEKVPSQWVYGGVLQGAGFHSLIYGGENADCPGEGFDKRVVYTDTLGQFTGMTDQNGAKIFEGDIIECWSEGVKARGTVQQRCDGLWIIYPAWQKNIMWGLCPYDDGTTTCIVIGNIHDNPELLKVSE